MNSNNLSDITSIKSGGFKSKLITESIRQLSYSWYWFVLSLIICLATGVAFLRYSSPRYEVNASILVKDETKGTDFGEAALLESLGLSSGKSNVDNEVEILKSRTLMESVVNDLQLYVQYFATGHVKTTEIFEKSPVLLRYIDVDRNALTKRHAIYLLTFENNNRYTLTDNIATWKKAFGDTIHLSNGLAILTKTAFKPIPEDKYSIEISGIDQTVNKYSQELSVSATNKLVSIIEIKLTDILPFKGEMLIKKLIENYLRASIIDKNRIADSTIAFIDQNLKLVSNELTGIEKQIEGFRTANHLTDINEQARLLLDNSSQYDKERITNEVQLKVIESLQNFISRNSSAIIPSSIIMQEPVFISLIEKYNGIQLVRERSQISATNDHPQVQNLDLQLKSIRQDLINNITSKKRELQINLRELDKLASGFQTQIDHIPAKERIFLDYTRNQEIKQELYVFLLKKRVETSISKSSNIANGRIIDPAKADILPVTPNSQLTYIVAILLGLGFPLAVFYLQDIFNTRITGKQEITDLLNIPVIAEIGHNGLKAINAIYYNNRGHIAEQFRSLRTSLQFLSALKKDQVILLTSSMGGEGKTFLALNLCATLQLAGKKVILIEFDLRKPKIAGYLNIKGKGLTEYLISDINMSDIIQPSGVADHFDVIISGPLPPNPAELILSQKVEELIVFLREKYDYIILDTAPIGLVTDARLLSQYADISLYIIRQKFTFRHQLEAISNIANNNIFPKLYLILNDVRAIPGYGYTYGYDNS